MKEMLIYFRFLKKKGFIFQLLLTIGMYLTGAFHEKREELYF